MKSQNNDKKSDDKNASAANKAPEHTTENAADAKPESPKTTPEKAKDIPKVSEKVTPERAQTKSAGIISSKVEKKPQTTAKTTSAKKKPTEKKPSPKAGLLLAILAIVLAIAAGVGVYFLYQQDQIQSAALAERLGELQSSINGNQQKLTRLSQLDTLKQEIDTVRSEVGNITSVNQRIEAEQQALNTALAAMSAKLGRTTVAWRLAEIEYLLITANTRLSLEHDRRTTLVALQTADQKLRAIGDPVFVPVRQTIALEITQLKAVQEPDITGMALTLGSLAKAVDDLPLVDTQPVRTSGPTAANSRTEYESQKWADIPSAIWNDIRGLVVVRRVDRPVEPLLPPAEEWYLRQNLQLKLEQARLSLLRHNTTLFRHELDEAAEWISAYFDKESSAVTSLLDTLQTLKKTDLQPSLPDISDSLRVLREHMKRLGQEVEAAQREGNEQ